MGQGEAENALFSMIFAAEQNPFATFPNSAMHLSLLANHRFSEVGCAGWKHQGVVALKSKFSQLGFAQPLTVFP